MHQYHPPSDQPVTDPPSGPIRFGILAILIIAGLLVWLGPKFLPSFSRPSSYAADTVAASQESDRYYLAKVITAINVGSAETEDGLTSRQNVKLRFLTGPHKGQEQEIDNGAVVGIYKDQEVTVGQTVVVIETATGEHFIYDKFRITPLIWLFALFLSVATWFGRWKGLLSIAGLVTSVLVLGGVAIPMIVAGHNPLLVCSAAAAVIAVISLYLAHGFSRRTTLALTSILITLTIATVLALLFIKFSFLYGLGSEEAFYLQIDSTLRIDLRGLLLGGIIIGALGVLDDVATVQVATVGELQHVAPHLTVAELYQRGIVVGREHIASLVNTLALAYVGAAFPLLLLFTINSTHPAWVTINSEIIAEEVVRTLVGSLALVLAVPIATYLAARALHEEK